MRDYSKVPNHLTVAIFDKLIDQKFDLDGLVEKLRGWSRPVLTDAEKLEKVREAFGDAETLFRGLPQREMAEELADILELQDCLPCNNDE